VTRVIFVSLSATLRLSAGRRQGLACRQAGAKKRKAFSKDNSVDFTNVLTIDGYYEFVMLKINLTIRENRKCTDGDNKADKKWVLASGLNMPNEVAIKGWRFIHGRGKSKEDCPLLTASR
jgi:hypothetical protein